MAKVSTIPSSSKFQSTHPRGVRLPTSKVFQTYVDVSIHAPAWGATFAWAVFGSTVQSFQSTHPRGVRPQPCQQQGQPQQFQSTHPRGVRLVRCAWTRKRRLFQSTHPRGVRHGSRYVEYLRYLGFNPRTRVGCDDPFVKDFTGRSWFQSTHPRGVRHGSRYVEYLRYLGFNPRTRVGCDLASEGTPKRLERFQSTHPRGVRPDGPSDISHHFPFQSTHPRGVRQEHRALYGSRYVVSIHAPAWGATRVLHALQKVGRGFNPRTRVGCDQSWRDFPAVVGDVSIHAPAWGATFRKTGSRTDYPMFQSTHPRGVRRHDAAIRRHDAAVSIHAPAWGATPYLTVYSLQA